MASAEDRVANKAKQLEAKCKMLAELEVATLVAAHAFKKGKVAAAAAAAAAAVAEECRAAEAQVLEARASISASLAAAVPEVPDSLVAELHSIATVMSYRGKHFRELLDGSGWRVASAPRGAETKRRSEGPVGMSFHVSCWDIVREFLTRVECMHGLVRPGAHAGGQCEARVWVMVLQARLEIFFAVQAVISVIHLVDCQSSWMQQICNLSRVFPGFKKTIRFSFNLCLNLHLKFQDSILREIEFRFTFIFNSAV